MDRLIKKKSYTLGIGGIGCDIVSGGVFKVKTCSGRLLVGVPRYTLWVVSRYTPVYIVGDGVWPKYLLQPHEKCNCAVHSNLGAHSTVVYGGLRPPLLSPDIKSRAV
jgi:hypothetical protein